MKTSQTFLKKSLAVLMAATAFFPAGHVLAQGTDQRLQTLEQRMDRFESKFDALLNLLQQQQDAKSSSSTPSAQAPAPETNTLAAKPTRLRMGQLYLDVYTLPLANKGDLPASSSEIAAASAVVDAGSFNFGDFASQTETRQLVSYNDTMIVSWGGIINIKKEGMHSFILLLNKKNDFGYNMQECAAHFVIEEKELISIFLDFYNESLSGRTLSDQGKISLNPGYYQFHLNISCRQNGKNTREKLSLSLLMAAPGDRSAKPIPAEMFGIKE